MLLLPALPYGTETNQMKFPLAMNLNPTTLARVITDLVDSLAAHGILRCVLLNGHGGNDLKWVLRELHRQTPVHMFLCNWYKVASDVYATIFEQKDDHAGEMETSMGLAHFPATGRARAGRRRGRPAQPLRGGQSRLGRDHPPLAPLDHQLGRRRPAGRHGRQRRSAHRRWSPSGSAGSSPSWPRARWTRHSRFDAIGSRRHRGQDMLKLAIIMDKAYDVL